MVNMAANDVSAASIVSSSFQRHDVFLSFRGEDTRKTFVSHLYNALYQKKIKTYKDDIKLQIGDEIPVGLFNAIEESKIAIVVFSKTYAFSSWCLSELNHIVQCQKRSRHSILPVFYDVDPSYVRNQKGSYGDAFVQVHEKSSKRTVEEINAWKHALNLSANLSGWDSRFMRSESELVDQIVKVVLRKLNRLSPVSDDDLNSLVGIHNQVREIRRLLCDGSSEERIIGIWGAGGIGKTTLASVVFNRFSTQFESCYFLPNASDELKIHGFTTLQAKLFAGLLEEDSVDIGTPSLISSSGKERLWNMKVLVVLDDVTSSDQFDKILLRSFMRRFGDGSRIIVTTRDLQVLTSIKACVKYKVEGLNGPSAIKLFCSHAFDEGSDTREYTELSNRVLHYAKGIPLALKIFGSYLYSKSKREWEDELDKLIPNQELQDLFERSYHGLDYESREIFLDIAAFFKDEDRCFVESILDGCKFSANIGIRKLLNKSLISIRRHDKLWMHNLVQQMGQEIICQKSRKDRGKRCRLWKAEDICEVLETDTGTEEIEGIFLDLTKIKDPLHLSSAVFSKMRKLRFLKIYMSGHMTQRKLYLSQEGLESLPKSLVYIHWYGYPLECLPSNFSPVNLVEIGMPYSKVQKLWNEDQNLGNLKRIDLSYSKNLTQLPDLSKASNVESINLQHCIRLRHVPLHQNLDKLTSLNLNGCSSLQNLSDLPMNITYLNIKNCSRLQSIPAKICELKSLCSLNLSGCSNLKAFPEISRPMECLIELILDKTAIRNLPSSITMLTALKTLSMDMCENLEVLPDSISGLDSLQSLSIRCCPKLLHLPAMPPSLPSVDARDCMSLQSVSNSKAVTEGWNCHHISGATFIFYNCPNLDRNSQNNITVDAQHRIMHIANVTSKYGRDPDMTEICWPGNEIPKCFKHQLERSSINVTLPPNQFDNTFLGFIFCVLVDFKDCILDGDFKIYCEAPCAFPDGFETTWRHTWIWHWNHHHSDSHRNESQKKENGTNGSACKSVNSPHVFLFYDNGRQIHSNLYARKDTSSSSSAYEKNVSVTFEFQSIDSNGRVNSSNCQVKSCGIRLLYAHDIMNLGFLSQDDEESTAEDNDISIVEDVELLVQEDEQNEQNLRENELCLHTKGVHLEENDEKKLTFCCFDLRTQMLEFCDRLSGKRSSGLHNGIGYEMRLETSRLGISSSQPMVVQEWPPLKYEQVVRLLMEVQDQNKQILQQLQLMKTMNPPTRFVPGKVPQQAIEG